MPPTRSSSASAVPPARMLGPHCRAARRHAHEHPRENPRAARHLPWLAIRHGPQSAVVAGSVSRRRDDARLDTLSRDHHGPRAVLNALERLANAYGSECARVKQDLSIAESQLRDYQARLGKPFLHDAYLTELTSLRDQLKAGLSATAHQPERRRGRALPTWPRRSRRSRPRTPSRPRRSASGRSIPPPRNPSPPASAGGRRQTPRPIKRLSRMEGHRSCLNPRFRIHPASR